MNMNSGINVTGRRGWAGSVPIHYRTAAGYRNLLPVPIERFRLLVTGHESPPLINIGVGEDHTVREIAEMVREAVGFNGRLVFDTAKPDGTPQKLLDITRLSKLGWRARTTFKEGVRCVYADFLRAVSASG